MTLRRAPDQTAADRNGGSAAGPADDFQAVPLPSDFDPTALLGVARAVGVVASYERPDHGFALVGVGEAQTVELQANQTPTEARAAVRRLVGDSTPSVDRMLRPRLLGGFRFAPKRPAEDPWVEFGSGRLVLPRILLVRQGGRCGAVLAPGVKREELDELLAAADEARLNATADRVALETVCPVNENAWIQSVGVIAGEIRAGRYEKAVLATSTELEGERDIKVGAALTQLREQYPDCHVFSFSANGSTFIGASPELLVARDGGRVHALGLAASQRRGDTVEEDDALGRALLADAKSREEHGVVVRSILERLADATTSLQADPEPSVRRFRNIQHLATEVIGDVAEGIEVLDLVERLHPTPAVCGRPREVAREVIARHERFDRGWYAGPVGWLDGDGDGEFAVALRSALVHGRHAWLFAGNGIMADSEPEAELAEVKLKFRPLAEALGGIVGSNARTVSA